MKIIPLGTSSGRPTATRNVSGLAVAAEGEWWLFDCGEGTQMQLARAGLSFHRLAGVFITHLHGDHFNGLAGLLSTMALDRRERPLTLVGPPGIREYLDTLAQLRILFYNYPVELRELGNGAFTDHDELIVYDTPRYTVVTRPLDHRIFSLGYRIAERERPGRFNLARAQELGIPSGPFYGQLQAGQQVTLADGRTIDPGEVLGPARPGKSVAYCLDTRPCDNSVALAQSVDWLIHEATFTSDLAEEAGNYGHSTARQAAETALAAGARNLLITHFSSRYPDPLPLLQEARSLFVETTMAEDLMVIDTET
ncbi:MAG: ribonuclease Z [Acidobacteriota bacterium]